MTESELLAATLDAGDYESAALAIIAHSKSRILSRRTVEKLFGFAIHGEVIERVDEEMIEVLGDLMLMEVPQ